MKMPVNKLRHVRGLLESDGKLSDGEKAMLISLIDNKIEDKKLDNSLAEFHHWIRMGEPILTAVERELEQLRSLTKEGGDTISKAAILEILEKYRNHKPKNEVDEGVNWVLGKVAEEIEKLHTA